jgi:hypothetical protein
MKIEELRTQISKQDFDKSFFSREAIEDNLMRDQIVSQMLTQPHIMVYYHCFYAVEEACQKAPQLFYEYWGKFAELLKHANSYHRDFGLILISLLAGVDVENNLDDLLPAYLEHANDKKFMTARCCVQNCAQIIQSRPDLAKRILARLLDIENASSYTESQASLLKADILDLMDQIFSHQQPDGRSAAWIVSAANCRSPKTRNKANELKKKLKLT